MYYYASLNTKQYENKKKVILYFFYTLFMIRIYYTTFCYKLVETQ